MPQGERRETVLHVVRRQGIVLSGGRGSSGSTSCRRVSAEKLFCVRGGGIILFWVGATGFRARRDAAGRAPGDGSARGEAPIYCSEREKGGIQARRVAAGRVPGNCLSWGGKQGGDCSERENGEFRLEGLPQGQRRETVLRGGMEGGGGRRRDIALGGGRGSSGLKTYRRASAGRLFCVGMGDGEAAGDWSEREKG